MKLQYVYPSTSFVTGIFLGIEMLALLMQGFQTMTADAFAKVQAAAAADKAAGTANSLVYDEQGNQVIDPLTNKPVRGPERYAALQAMQQLMQMSTLLPSIKKIATMSGRNLRVMQMAEERALRQSHL